MSVEQTSQETQIDPLVRAVAEARARDAGKSVSDYLADLLMIAQTSSLPHLLTAGVGHTTEHLGEGLHSSFSKYLIDTARDIRDRNDADHWSRLVAGSTPWLASEATASPALRLVFVFNYRIQSAALLMSAAFQEAAVHDFDFAKARSVSRRGSTTQTWYNSIVHNVVDCSRQVRNALVHEWKPTPRAERLAIDAFVILSDLTPARNELLRLCRYDRPRAFSELARHVELAADQFRLSADLLAEVEGVSRPQELPSEVRFAEMARLLLQRAGGGLSLTEAAKLLGTSRQALHKRVKTGSALGLMDGAELVIPKFQFVEDDDHTLILEGLAKIIKLFDASKAGRWSALQFLLEQDPNLGVAPIQTLRTGEVQQVVDAAAAYLDVDED
jgi:predicted transcriptional regulator